MSLTNLLIGIDLDDTVFSWYDEYLKLFKQPKSDFEITKNVYRKLRKNKEFWENLPIINYPDFIPELICTKRVNSKAYTRNSLKRLGLEKVPIYQVWLQTANKADKIKGKIDVFIDDSISNFIQMNLAGVPCLLIDSPYNKEWGPIGRVYSLKYKEIVQAYNLFMNTVFHNFKQLV